MPKVRKLILVFFAIVATAFAVYAALVDRSYYLDGVLFLWDVLTTKQAFYAPDHYRFSSYFFQLPAIIFSRLGMDSAANISFNFMYLLLPYLFPFILQKRNRIDGAQFLMTFYFYVVVVSALIFAVNYATETALIGWGLFIVLLSGPIDLKKLIVSVILLICLVLSYETGILLFLPVLAFVFFDRKNQTEIDYRITLGIFTTIFLCKFGLNFETTINLADTPVVHNFKKALATALPLDRSPFLYSYAFISLILFIPLKRLRHALMLIIFLIYCYFVFTTSAPELFNTSHSFRSFVVPLAFGGMTLVLIDRFTPFKMKVDGFAYGLLFLFITVSLSRDLRATRHWHVGKNLFLDKIANSQGCITLPEDEAHAGLYYHGIIDENVSKTSVLWQIGSKIKTVIHPGFREYDYYKGVNFCENYSELEKMYIIQYRGGYFPDNIRFDSEYIQSRLGFEPKRKVFKVSELNDCQTTNILNFAPDDTVIVNDTDREKFNLTIHGNDNDQINFKVALVTEKESKKIELGSRDSILPVDLKAGKSLIIKKLEDKWFDDRYHPNRYFYAVKCLIQR